MTTEEVIDLLTVITAVDRRTVGEADVQAWSATVGDLDFTDARAAVLAHYRDKDTWLMPVHVRRGVTAIRGERLARAELGPATEDPDVLDNARAYLAAVRSQTRQAASSSPDNRQIGGAR